MKIKFPKIKLSKIKLPKLKVKIKFSRITLIILIIIFLSPFVGMLICDFIKQDISTLYTFGLDRKDFFTCWIALFGAIGIAYNIVLTQKRTSQNEKQLRDNRFSLGAELLGNEKESARIGGAYNLYFLAREYPNEYLHSVCDILCSHIRTITDDKEYQEKYKEKPQTKFKRLLICCLKKKVTS